MPDKKQTIEEDIEDIEKDTSNFEDFFNRFTESEIEVLASHQNTPSNMYKKTVNTIGKSIYDNAEIINFEIGDKNVTALKFDTSILKQGERSIIGRLSRDPIIHNIVNERLINENIIDGIENVGLIVGQPLIPDFHLLCKDYSDVSKDKIDNKLNELNDKIKDYELKGVNKNSLQYRNTNQEIDCIKTVKGEMRVKDFDKIHIPEQNELLFKINISNINSACSKLDDSVKAFKESSDISNKLLNDEINILEMRRDNDINQKKVLNEINGIIFTNNSSKDTLKSEIEKNKKDIRNKLKDLDKKIYDFNQNNNSVDNEKRLRELIKKRDSMEKILKKLDINVSNKDSIHEKMKQLESWRKINPESEYVDDIIKDMNEDYKNLKVDLDLIDELDKIEEEIENYEELIEKSKKGNTVLEIDKLKLEKSKIEQKLKMFNEIQSISNSVSESEFKTKIDEIRLNNNNKIEKIMKNVKDTDKIISELKGNKKNINIDDIKLEKMYKDKVDNKESYEFQSLRLANMCKLFIKEKNVAPPITSRRKGISDDVILKQIRGESKYIPMKGRKIGYSDELKKVIKEQEDRIKRRKEKEIHEPRISRNVLNLDDIEIDDD